MEIYYDKVNNEIGLYDPDNDTFALNPDLTMVGYIKMVRNIEDYKGEYLEYIGEL